MYAESIVRMSSPLKDSIVEATSEEYNANRHWAKAKGIGVIINKASRCD